MLNMLFAEKISNNQNMLTIDLLSYLFHLKYILKIENHICIAKNQIAKFKKFNNMIIYISENTNMHVYYMSMYHYICMYGRNHCNQRFTFLKPQPLIKMVKPVL